MKFLNDIVLTGAGADLTAPATVTFSGLSATTETNAVVINSSGVLSKRTLGSNAFNSTGIPTGNAIIDWTASGAGTIHASNYIENVVQTTVSGNAGTVTNGVYTTGNQTIAGNKTFSGDLTISQTDATAPGVMLNLHNVSNGVGTTIRCTDVSAGTSQFGDITYRHQDSKSYGSAAMFELGSTESTTTILANGKLMYNEGIYSKPSSGTGAGTRKDANWDTAYGWGDHSTEGYLTDSSTQTKYLRTDTSDTAAGFITLSGGVTGSNSLMTSFFLPQNPEGSHVKAPWFFNDMAYSRLRGSTITVTVNGGSSPSNSNIDAMFDASTGFWNMSTSGVSSVVIEITNPPKTMYHGAHYGVTFGNTNWRAKNVDIDTFYSSGYQEVVSITGNTKEFVYGAKNSGGNAVSKIKWTFSDFNTTSMRIVSLFAYNYNATGMPSLYLTKDGGEMFGAIDMNSNKITELGTPTGNADAATKAYVDGAVIANTDTQDLSISGQTLSLTNGGSVTLPDTNTVYTHPTSAGNKHIPTGGESGQFLKYTSSGTAVWATPSYTTNTNTTYTTATSSTLGLVKIGYTESGKNYPVELSSGKMYVNVPWANTQNNDEEDAAEGTKGVVELATNDEVIEGTDSGKATTSRGVKGAIDGIAVPILGNKTIGGVKTFSSTIVGSVNGNSATTSERTITSGEISNISTNTSKVGITTGSQTIAGSKTFSSPIKGQVIGIASHSGYINKTAAQFASDGTDKVYIGSNNYGWNDSRDTATNLVDVDAPVINQNDQHNGIICPVNLSQVSIMSQVRMNAADGTMQVRVYKMARATGVNTSNLALTQIATASVSTVNGRMTTLDATGSTAVSAGDLIIVGFGKTSGGNGQKPRINFTLTGTTV